MIYGVGVNDLKESRSSLPHYDKAYVLWHGVLQRSYDPKWSARHDHYKDTSCDSRWHIFSNFYQDIIKFDNFLLVDELKLQLDKDLRVFGLNKYSKETCSFVPRQINNALVSPNDEKDDEGITWRIKNKKFQVRLSMYGKVKNLGLYSCKKEAVQVYQTAKENYIHELAEKYKHILHKDVYNNLIQFKGCKL